MGNPLRRSLGKRANDPVFLIRLEHILASLPAWGIFRMTDKSIADFGLDSTIQGPVPWTYRNIADA